MIIIFLFSWICGYCLHLEHSQYSTICWLVAWRMVLCVCVHHSGRSCGAHQYHRSISSTSRSYQSLLNTCTSEPTWCPAESGCSWNSGLEIRSGFMSICRNSSGKLISLLIFSIHHFDFKYFMSADTVFERTETLSDWIRNNNPNPLCSCRG